jgi:3-hexulose-6-phosphate synthase
MRPKLQLALDVINLDQALTLCAKTDPWVDWFEVGTPLIISEGLKSVTSLNNIYPNKTLLADVKIVDGASLIAAATLEAHADIITVLSAASDQTIKISVDLAHKRACKTLGDHVSNQIVIDSYRRLEDLGVDYIGVHIPKDSGAGLPLTSLEKLLEQLTVPVVLAGGITKQRLALLKGLPIHAVVVGSAIINCASPDLEVQEFASILNNWS